MSLGAQSRQRSALIFKTKSGGKTQTSSSAAWWIHPSCCPAPSPPMSSSSTASSLAAWAKEEFGFVPKKGGEDVFQKLCAGPMSSRWAHLVRHVRSRENLRSIRANLAVDRHRKRVEQQSRPQEESEEDAERRDLTSEIRRSEEALSRCRQAEAAARAAAAQARRECQEVGRELLRADSRLAESRQVSMLLGAFGRKCREDTAAVDAFKHSVSNEIAPELFRDSRNEEKFYSGGGGGRENDMEVRTAAEHAVFECTKRAKELLLRAVSGDDGGDLGEEEEAKAELLSRMRQLTGGASAPDLAKALESAADAAVRTAREERDRLDVREEAEKARLSLESSGVLRAQWNPSGSLPSGSTDRLLVDLARRHLAAAEEAEAAAEAAAQEEEQLEDKRQELERKLAELVPDDYVRTLALRLALLESCAARGEAAVAQLKRRSAERSARERAKDEGTESVRKELERAAVAAAERVSNSVSTLEALISEIRDHHRVDSGEFPLLRRETRRILEEDLRTARRALMDMVGPDGEEEKERRSLQGKPASQLRAMLSVGGGGFREFMTTLVRGADGNVVPHHTTSLTIHRLLLLHPDEPSHGGQRQQLQQLVFPQLLSNLSLPREARSLSLLTLAASAAEESAESSWWARWAAGDKVSGRMKRDLLRAEDLLCQLDRHDERQTSALLPLLREESRRLEEEGARRRDSAERAIQTWRNQPAQETVAADAALTAGGMTLKKWQERFRVALARWHQHQQQGNDSKTGP